MLPHRLHYCWLSGDPFSPGIRACMETWKHFLPGFEWVLWDQERLGETDVAIVQAAMAARKWAFAADYIRLHALYHEGGLYLDSDVYLRQPVENLLQGRFISAVEHHEDLFPQEGLRNGNALDAEQLPVDKTRIFRGLGVQAAFMASEPGHPFVKGALDYYRELAFSADGSFTPEHLAPEILAHVMMEFGFRYIDKEQRLDEGIYLYSTKIIAPTVARSNRRSVAIHYCAGGWQPPQNGAVKKSLLQRIKGHKFLRKLLGRPPRLTF